MMKKPYDKSKTKDKPKMTVTMYEKAFESFTEMIDALRGIHPEFENIFIYDDSVVLPTDSAIDVMNYFAKNFPNATERKNIPVTISISANKVSMKTSKFFSFEWSFKYDKEGNISDLVSIITTFTREKNFEDLDNMISKLKESWNVKVVDNKKKFNNREARPVNKEAVTEVAE